MSTPFILPASSNRIIYSDDGKWSPWSEGERSGQLGQAGSQWVLFLRGDQVRVYGAATSRDAPPTTLTLSFGTDFKQTFQVLGNSTVDNMPEPAVLLDHFLTNFDHELTLTSDGPYILEYVEIKRFIGDSEAQEQGPNATVAKLATNFVDNKDPKIRFGPSPSDWQQETAYTHYEKSVSVTRTGGAWFEFDFIGSAIYVFNYWPKEGLGEYRVTFDNVTQKAGQDAFGDPIDHQILAWSKDGFEYGNHTVRFELNKSTAGSGMLSLDFIRFAGEPVAEDGGGSGGGSNTLTKILSIVGTIVGVGVLLVVGLYCLGCLGGVIGGLTSCCCGSRDKGQKQRQRNRPQKEENATSEAVTPTTTTAQSPAHPVPLATPASVSATALPPPVQNAPYQPIIYQPVVYHHPPPWMLQPGSNVNQPMPDYSYYSQGYQANQSPGGSTPGSTPIWATPAAHSPNLEPQRSPPPPQEVRNSVASGSVGTRVSRAASMGPKRTNTGNLSQEKHVYTGNAARAGATTPKATTSSNRNSVLDTSPVASGSSTQPVAPTEPGPASGGRPATPPPQYTAM